MGNPQDRRRASLSAAKTGRVPVYMAKHPRFGALLPSGAGERAESLLLAAEVLKPWMTSLFDKKWFPTYLDRMERHTAPGLSLHIALRKRFIDDEIRRAIEEGTRQILMVGAGYDTLCLRLAPMFPELTFVEIDHPATHARKVEGVRKLGVHRNNLHLLGADLESHALGDILDDLAGTPGANAKPSSEPHARTTSKRNSKTRLIPYPGHRPRPGSWSSELPTAVVAEGVLMYLKRRAVGTFLDTLHQHVGSNSRLLFSYMRGDEHGEALLGEHAWLIRLGMKIAGEHLEWGIDPQHLACMLRSHGFRYTPDPARFDLRERYLISAGLGDAALSDLERVAVAYVDRSLKN